MYKQLRFLTTLLLLAVCVGAWAEEATGTISFGSATGSTNINSASVTGNDDLGNSWTVTTVGTTSFTPNGNYAQVGSSSKPATSITFTMTLPKEVKFSMFSAKFGGFTGTAGSVTLKIDDTSVKTGQLNGTVDYNFVASNLTKTGKTLTVTVTGISKGVKCYNIAYTYEEISSDKLNPSLSFPEQSYNASLGQTFTAPTLTNTYNVSPITWSSSQENVATVDGNGTVTLVGGGTTIIKASFDGTNDPTYSSDEAQYELTVTDPSIITLWSEDFSSYGADDVPSGGTYGYNCTNGGGTTKIYNQNNAGGTAPELLVGKSSGTFSATVPLNNASGTLTLTYKTNAKTMSVSTTTEGITGGDTFNAAGEHTVTFTGVTTSMTSITIVFTTSSDNVRLDDIELRGNGQLAAVEAPTFNINGGTYYTEQTVELSCATEGATIKYSYDEENWQTYTEALTISETKTIYAKAEKDGAESTITSITITIAEKNDVVFNISNKELVYDESYTVTKGTYSGRDVQTDGFVTVTTDNENILTVSGMTITAAAVGTATITLSAAEGDTYKAGNTTFTVTVTAPEGQTAAPDASALFEERFNSCNGSGPSGESWSGNTASTTFNSDNEGWEGQKPYAGQGCARFGTGSVNGSATTPAISFVATTTYTLSFKAGAWNGDNTTLTVSCDDENAEIGSTSFTMQNNAWTAFTTTIKAAPGSKITFAASGRFFLDDVVVTDPNAHVEAPTLTLSDSGYASYCCEYPLDFTNIDKDTFKAWYVSAVDMTSGDVTFSEITGSIKGGEAFFLYGTPGAECQLAYAESSSEVLDGNKLVGTLAPTYVENGNGIQNYGLSGGKFVKMGNGVVNANKSYLPVEVGTETPARLNIIFESQEATGISNSPELNTKSGEVYNLQGQKVGSEYKGIVIKNNKKYFVK